MKRTARELRQLALQEREPASPFDLSGRAALVTDVSCGIGRAVALALARAGADVAVRCAGNAAAATAVCDEIRQMGRKAEAYALNVSNPREAGKLRAEVVRDFDRVDVLVNSAGAPFGTPRTRTARAWDAALAAYLDGVFLITKGFVGAMAARGWGRVINLPVPLGEADQGGPGDPARSALVNLSRTLAREYARKGVTVNVVAPGFITTQRAEAVPGGELEAAVRATPVGRLGTPEEVAAGVVFLASDDAAFVTGHVLDINGGYIPPGVEGG
jgi:3-oxoacyl-[acyl-carrier protein] reductase